MDWPKSLKEEFAFSQVMIVANSSGSIRVWQAGSSDSSHGSAKALEIWRNPWRCTSATPKGQERENMLGLSGYLQCLRLDFHCRTRKPTAQALKQTGLSQNERWNKSTHQEWLHLPQVSNWKLNKYRKTAETSTESNMFSGLGGNELTCRKSRWAGV